MQVNVLAVGDVCAPAGLQFFCRKIHSVKKEHQIAFTVVNGENAAYNGLTPDQVEELLDAGADVITLGNHTYSKTQIIPSLSACSRLLRPANLGPDHPGSGSGIYESSFGPVLVMNLLGRCGMSFGPENPFPCAAGILRDTPREVKCRLIDFHAEATSEKLALGWYLDGRVSAVWGTHTHVQTNDADVLPRGTGYLTDLGMTGPALSVIGAKPEQSVDLFLNKPPRRLEPAAGPCKLEGAVFTLDTDTGLCVGARTVRVR